MRWVVFLELQGFYAAGLRKAQGLEAEQPLLVVQNDRIVDSCAGAVAQGVRLGSTVRQARQDCPGAVAAAFDQSLAEGEARRWWDCLVNYTPWVETVSPHQAFIDLAVSGTEPPLPELERLLASLAPAFGFRVWAGIGPSKLTARAAVLAQQGKAPEYRLLCPWAGQAAVPTYGGQGPQAGSSRGGLYSPNDEAHGHRPKQPAGAAAVIRPGQEGAFLASLPIEVLWPAGRDALQRLRQLGLTTVGELARVPEGELARQFGVAGRQFHRWARGIDPEPVRVNYPCRELVRQFYFAAPPEQAELEAALGQLVQGLTLELRRSDEGCQQISLSLFDQAGRQWRLSRSFSQPEQRFSPLETAGLQLLRQTLAELIPAVENALPEAPSLGVAELICLQLTLGQLGPVEWRQMDLLDEGALARRQRQEHSEKLDGVLGSLRSRFSARNVGLGRGALPPLPRRESVLQLIDPYRWQRGGEAAPPPGMAAIRRHL